MFLFAPIAGVDRKKQKEYAALLKEIQTTRSSVFVTSLILSEYANRCLRLSFDLWKKEKGRPGSDYKKEYRQTPDYQDALADVREQIKAILKIAEKRPDDFAAIDILKVLSNTTISDFNDAYYIELCKMNRLKIVTDDQDFLAIPDNVDVEIITI